MACLLKGQVGVGQLGDGKQSNWLSSPINFIFLVGHILPPTVSKRVIIGYGVRSSLALNQWTPGPSSSLTSLLLRMWLLPRLIVDLYLGYRYIKCPPKPSHGPRWKQRLTWTHGTERTSDAVRMPYSKWWKWLNLLGRKFMDLCTTTQSSLFPTKSFAHRTT